MLKASISFDHAADFYDATRALPAPVEHALAEAIQQELRAVKATHVLEVGVGTGRIARPVAARGVRVCGVDIAPRMLRRLLDQLGPLHLPPDLVLGDATCLPLKSDSFQAVMLCHVLHLIPDWRVAIAEMRRVLSPGGIVIHHSEHNDGGSDWQPVSDRWDEALAARGFLERKRPEAEDIDAIFTEFGGFCRRDVIAHWDRSYTPAEMLDETGRRVHSWTWEIPEELFGDCLREIEPWVAEYYGNLNRQLTRHLMYELQVWSFS